MGNFNLSEECTVKYFVRVILSYILINLGEKGLVDDSSVADGWCGSEKEWCIEKEQCKGGGGAAAHCVALLAISHVLCLCCCFSLNVGEGDEDLFESGKKVESDG